MLRSEGGPEAMEGEEEEEEGGGESEGEEPVTAVATSSATPLRSP